MALMRIKKGDMVQVMSGREQGKIGKVLEILLSENRAIVEKLNMVKKHTRPNKQKQQGGIIEKEAPLSIASIMPYCAKCKKGVRVATKVTKGKKEDNKIRVCVHCEEALEVSKH